MLTVPSVSHHHHQSHKEMRRSASEQAPASSQQTVQSSEIRSKSFDYGSLSSQQSTSSWKERRKFLLVKQATLGEPEQEIEGTICQLSRTECPKPGPSHSDHSSLYSEADSYLYPEAPGKALQLLQPHIFPSSQDMRPLQLSGQHTFPRGSISQLLPVTSAIPEVLPTQIVHRTFLHSHTRSPLVHTHPTQIHMPEQLRIPLHQLPPLVPLPISRTRVSNALYFPVPSRLTTYVPSQSNTRNILPVSSMPSSIRQQSLVTVSYHQQQPVIATCLAQLTPVVSLVVPVRLQTHRPTFASAMYTTLSQILASTHSQESTSCTAMIIMSQSATGQEKLHGTYLKVPSTDIKSLLPLSMPKELASGPEEGYGPLGPGGSKRMLSPAASLELSTEAQRHQKRVKEEEQEERRGGEEVDAEPKGLQKEECKEKTLEVKENNQPDRIDVASLKLGDQSKNYREKEGEKKSNEMTSHTKKEVPTTDVGVVKPSTSTYPSLRTSTSVNWCYLNYVKPSPSAHEDPLNSVYSTWSISAHNSNLPGLSTKVALSLLCSKQKHSSETYTMASAPTSAREKQALASTGTPQISEVIISTTRFF